METATPQNRQKVFQRSSIADRIIGTQFKGPRLCSTDQADARLDCLHISLKLTELLYCTVSYNFCSSGNH